jgi:monoamine oxidase
MAGDDVEVAIVGGGAAGVAAARRLHDAGVDCLLIEARGRLGGRAWTVTEQDYPLDLGCGWLHSADRNPWRDIARELGFGVDTSAAPWSRPSLALGFPRTEQQEFQEATAAFFERLENLAKEPADVPGSAAFEPGNRWNPLIDALSTYISGVEWERVSAKDFDRYDDSGVNWRVVEGLGATVAAYGAKAPVAFDCPVHRIDHSGKRLRIDTAKGPIAADRAIIAVPSTVLAEERVSFTPALPEKMQAARNLPLGHDNKLFMSLEHADEFNKDLRVFGHTDRTATAGYSFRPFGRPLIEAFFGGRCAEDLEAQGDAAFFDFAAAELSDVFGNDFRRRLKPICVHRWGADPFARGAYAYARLGFADCRATLAAPVDGRLFFAGEACSPHDFSTAHGAFASGVTAADQVMAARRA